MSFRYMKQITINDDVWKVRVGDSHVEIRHSEDKKKYILRKEHIVDHTYNSKGMCYDCCEYGKDCVKHMSVTPQNVKDFLNEVHYV